MDHVIEFNLFEGFHDDVECILLQSVDGCGNHPKGLGDDNEDLQALQFHVLQKVQAAEARYFQGDGDGHVVPALERNSVVIASLLTVLLFRYDHQDSTGDQPVHCESLLHHCGRL